MTPPVSVSENYTQPENCYYSRDNIPNIHVQFTTLVPVYQTDHNDTDMFEILDSCCRHDVWLYEDPEPCTAVCNSRNDAQAQEVQYCLNAKDVNYGLDAMSTSSGASATMQTVSMRKLWTFAFVGGLVLSVW